MLLEGEEETALCDLEAHVSSEVHRILGRDITQLVRCEYVPTFRWKADKAPTKISSIKSKKTNFHKH